MESRQSIHQNLCSALALAGNTIYAVGEFTLQNSLGQLRLAAFPGAGAPEISVPPENRRVPQGQSVTLSARATGQQPFAYQWRFNGTNLPSATNASLTLSNVQANDSGAYLVIVANVLGAITAEARVSVLVPVTITNQPLGQAVAPGTAVMLSVGASGDLSMAAQWREHPGRSLPHLHNSKRAAARWRQLRCPRGQRIQRRPERPRQCGDHQPGTAVGE